MPRVHPSPVLHLPSGALILYFGAPGLVLPLGLCTPDMKTMVHAEVSFGSSSHQGMPPMVDGHRLCLGL